MAGITKFFIFFSIEEHGKHFNAVKLLRTGFIKIFHEAIFQQLVV